MTMSTDRASKGSKPRLSDQLKASDLFPPGVGWNTAPGAASDARVDHDARKAPQPSPERVQH